MLFKKLVIAGGTGQIGSFLCSHFKNITEEIIVLSRSNHEHIDNVRFVYWDGKTAGNWISELENSDIIINLTGKNVNCRLTEKNKNELLNSRINSVMALTNAIHQLKTKPKLWIQSSAIGIYDQSYDTPLSEENENFGNDFMSLLCKKWEDEFSTQTAQFPWLRKVIIRTSLVLSRNEGVIPRLTTIVKLGLGGHQGSGNQFVSWIHEKDFACIIEHIASNNQIQGIINITSPTPIKNREMMSALRNFYKIKIGFPAPSFAIRLGAFFIGTQAGLVLNSHKILPKRISDFGYKFIYPQFNIAIKNLLESK